MLSLDIELRRHAFDLVAQLELNGNVTGLFGPSGSGKSSLLGIIAGLIRPQRGTIVLDGETLFDSTTGICLPPHRRRIGLVFQDSQLFPHYSVKGNLLYGLKQTPTNQRRFRFDDIVDLLGLAPLLNAHPRNISGGEKQRVALGRSLLASPRLLLLDEPLASLDQGLKAQILPFLQKIRDELQLPMIYVSHALSEILHLTDRLVLIEQGRIVAAGVLHEILQNPRQDRADPLGLDNTLPVTIESHDIEGGCTLARFRGLRLALPLRSRLEIGRIAYVSVHRGEVALSRQAVTGLSIQNQVPGRIVEIEPRGDGVAVRIDAGAPLLAEITPRAWRELNLREGETVYGLIKTRSFSYLIEQTRAEFESPAP
ncbi:molybdenum ABC transporter ATP-binding protein [Methylocaldum sp. MU1018]